AFAMLIVLINSCKKNNSESTIEQIPVKYFLLNKHKDIFFKLTANPILLFTDSANNADTIVMKSDGLLVQHFFTPNEVRQGEQFINYFTCQSKYLETFKIGYQMFATSDSSSCISIYSISGNLSGNKRSANYVISRGSLNIIEPSDSVFKYTHGFSYSYFDTLTLSKKTYKNCYLLQATKGLSNYFYFNSDFGLIKFNTNDAKVWTLIVK
ncbi:MAG: hypothetical protein ACKVQB_12175, partial [Bacteroidia bacterium]